MARTQYRMVRRNDPFGPVVQSTIWIDVPGKKWMRKRAEVQKAIGHAATDHTPANFQFNNPHGQGATDIEWRLRPKKG